MSARTLPPEGDPLVFSAKPLHRQPGASRHEHRVVVLDRAWGNEVAHAAHEQQVEMDFLMESAHDGVLVAGQAAIPIQAECVRCLEPVNWQQDVDVQQFFAYPESTPKDAQDPDPDVARMERDLLDLRPAFRDAVVLALPLTPVCRDDCPGLCSDCGFPLAQDPDHHHDRIDPRWADLAHMRSEPSNETKPADDDRSRNVEGE